MFLFSDGLTYTGSTEKSIAYLLFQSKTIETVPVGSKLWKYWGEKPIGTRLYKSKYYGRLEIFKKPLPDKRRKLLYNTLDSLSTSEKHPALGEGFAGEAKRLFPLLNNEVTTAYSSFIAFLNQVYRLEEKAKKAENLVPYCDDIGPFMMGRIGNRDFVIPELPQVFLAPELWRDITWIINNYLSGPYPISEETGFKEHFHWCNVKIDPILNTPYHEGTAYFLIAKFIIIYEAFSKNEKGNSLQLYIDLIQNQGIRPWQQLF